MASSRSDSSVSCIRPPSSLLIERPLSSPSPQSFKDTLDDQARPPSAAVSSLSHVGTGSPTHCASSDRHPDSCAVSDTSSIEAISIPPGLPGAKRADEPQSATLPIVLRHQFDGPRPVHPSVVYTDYMEFPPPSRDKYNNDPEFVYGRPETSYPIKHVEGLLAYHASQGDQLLNLLALQSKINQENYAQVTRDRENLKKRQAEINSQRMQFGRAAASRALRRAKKKSDIKLQDFIPKLTRAQKREILDLEERLVESCTKVSVGHAVAEGAIAGAFTLAWDHADQVPTEHHVSVLRVAQGMGKLFPTPIIKVDEESELAKLERETEEKKRTARRNLLRPLLDEGATAARNAYQNAFLTQKNRDGLAYLPSPALTKALEKTATSSTSNTTARSSFVPEWFTIFITYNIIKFEAKTLLDKFNEYLNTVWKLEARIENPDERPKWDDDKKWHNPSPSWSTPEPVIPQNPGDFSFDDLFETSWADDEAEEETPETSLEAIEKGVKRAMAAVEGRDVERVRAGYM
ncbi:hypothetical protein FALBO_3478 [Fusarium albosuccineum]|uniref:Uncharacterized protein n=1 Tax=Fusarium albosuccineum TaxID=1237068 RepID=A0A8H4LIX9_9HYPO|nr:hypothetical protein FALBO_3478 [Fusarium albosuccineum]